VSRTLYPPSAVPSTFLLRKLSLSLSLSLSLFLSLSLSLRLLSIWPSKAECAVVLRGGMHYRIPGASFSLFPPSSPPLSRLEPCVERYWRQLFRGVPKLFGRRGLKLPPRRLSRESSTGGKVSDLDLRGVRNRRVADGRDPLADGA